MCGGLITMFHSKGFRGLVAAGLLLASVTGLWANELKTFVSKENQFRVKVGYEMTQKNVEEGVLGYRTENEPSAANNGYAVLVMTGKKKMSRYDAYKFLVSNKIFGGKTNLKETKVAGFPALDFEGLSDKGIPLLGKIVATPARTFVVLSGGYETNAARDFVSSFQLSSVAQESCTGKCESGCKSKCDSSCKQSCNDKKKSECSGECSK